MTQKGDTRLYRLKCKNCGSEQPQWIKVSRREEMEAEEVRTICGQAWGGCGDIQPHEVIGETDEDEWDYV